jgi:hypothetical protein
MQALHSRNQSHFAASDSFTCVSVHTYTRPQSGVRAVVLVDVYEVGTSCGYVVPIMEFKSTRPKYYNYVSPSRVRLYMRHRVCVGGRHPVGGCCFRLSSMILPARPRAITIPAPVVNTHDCDPNPQCMKKLKASEGKPWDLSYQVEKNAVSRDGLPGLRRAREGASGFTLNVGGSVCGDMGHEPAVSPLSLSP